MSTENKKININQVILMIALSIFTLVCVLPVLLVVIVSFSTEASITEKGFSFFPTGWTLDGYKYLLTFKDSLITGYMVTIFETVFGTLLSLLVTSMYSFALARRSWRARGFLTGILITCMLFNGGAVATYIINTNVYQFRNNLLVLIIPGGLSVGNVIIMRTFINSNIPEALIDAAKIDGASEGYLYWRVTIPLMKPCLASIGFMGAVGHWNQWYTSMLYFDDPKLTSLQLLLVRIEKDLEYLKSNLATLTAEESQMLLEMPSDSVRMAILLATLGPMLVIYPFFQKYFTKGMTMGAVKG
ncbi:MAG: carbohydrate ABC transporter permease [Lachnospiraceae bacterium]|nr:carbohydrate ABC transporter permease [Lachnospiraceae bacterium]